MGELGSRKLGPKNEMVAGKGGGLLKRAKEAKNGQRGKERQQNPFLAINFDDGLLRSASGPQQSNASFPLSSNLCGNGGGWLTSGGWRKIGEGWLLLWAKASILPIYYYSTFLLIILTVFGGREWVEIEMIYKMLDFFYNILLFYLI